MNADRLKAKTFPIGYVALATGLSPHVIRVWERRYRAVTPEREGKKRRLYSQADIDRLLLLKRARMHGRRIGSVAKLDEEKLHHIGRDDFSASLKPGSEWSQPVADPCELLGACGRAVGDMDASALVLALRRAEAHLSRTAFLTDVVAPLMHRIGDEWSAKSLGIMHEHFASNIVKGFLSDLLGRRTQDNHAPRMVITTPAGQRHEIGALAAGVAAADCGWKVYCFGPDLPSAEIAAAAESKKAEAVCLSITRRSHRDAMSRELNRLQQQVGSKVRVLIGGQAAAAFSQAVIASNFHFFRSLSDFIGFISHPGPALETSAAAARIGH